MMYTKSVTVLVNESYS